jgi:hypothetical protein
MKSERSLPGTWFPPAWANARAPAGESELRHPRERPIFISFVVLNLAILAAAMWITIKGADKLDAYPAVKKYISHVRTVVIAAILAPPVLTLLRNTRHAIVRGRSVRLSQAQIPEIYGVLEGHCRKLGLQSPPELYFSRTANSNTSQAYSSWHCDYIVLGADFLQPDLEKVRDVYTFQLGRELGRIRLGHTRWWDEMLIAYVVKIPYLRNILLHVRTYSNDRYGAFLAPECVRGLVILAAGRIMLPSVNLPDYLRQAAEFRGTWAQLSELLEPQPHTLSRIGALYESGLFRIENDLRRFSPAPPVQRGGIAHA